MSVPPTTAVGSSSVASELQLRDPLQIDRAVGRYFKRIDIAHPAWPEGQDVFLALNALDDWEMGASHFNTVWFASAIVAGNSFDGYLSSSRDLRAQPLALGADDMLEAGKYWFHVSDPHRNQDTPANTPYLYPIVRDFHHWTYPHGQVPDFWPQTEGCLSDMFNPSIVLGAVHGADLFCRVTGHLTGVQAAHICPVSEQQWFGRNSMRQYLDNGIQDSANVLLLRADIYATFDKADFVFVPKQGQGFVVHFLESSPDLMPMYNNQKIHPTERLSGHCLLVRFAWAIFKQLQIAWIDDAEEEFWWIHRIYTDDTFESDLGSETGSTADMKGKRSASGPATDERQSKRVRAAQGIEASHGRSGQAPDDSMNDNGFHFLGTPRSMTPTHDDGCESCEEREDRRQLEVVSQDFPEVANPSELEPRQQDFYNEIVVYPGHRRVERMKERALEMRRPEGYNPSSDDPVLDFEEEV